MKSILKTITVLSACLYLAACSNPDVFVANTNVTIVGDDFYVNGKPTYAGRQWKGYKVEGLLLNSRMVQGIFDDTNPESVSRWIYPDDSLWSAQRNTDEFVAAMDEWAAYGLNSFTVNLQGGSPMGYGNQNTINSAFDKNGELKPAYMKRLSQIITKADDLNMVVILGYFYFGQDQFISDEQAVINATQNATNWLLEKAYRNVIVEVANECDYKAYDHDIIKADRIHELITLVKNSEKDGYRLIVGTSYMGNRIPKANVVKVSDYLLIHGNGVEDPLHIATMVAQTKAVEGYKGCPIVFNEDDHYDFDKEVNNFGEAVKHHVSWGYFDFRRDGESFSNGFQSVPVDWRVNSKRKEAFFNLVKEISGK